jgi:cyclophilin family peptidyl-prolyl cis-trans isomerase
MYLTKRDTAAVTAPPAQVAAVALPQAKTATPAMMEQGVEVTFTTSDGPIAATLWPKLAPQHVEQVLKLIRAGVYDGSVIFRIEKNFVIQFGGTYERPAPLTAVQQAFVKTIPAEFSDVKHERGILSMARQDDPNSADTSFSILLGPAPHLDGKYTVFGKMHPESDDTLKKIEAEALNPGTTHPVQAVQVLKATAGG